MSKEIVKREETPVAATDDARELLRVAVERGDIDTVEKIVALHERAQDRAAAREFAGAMADFQAKCPPIPKTSRASIATKSGANYGYTYAELDQIAKVINPILGPLGLSYTWDSGIDGGMLRCTCTLRHVNGHSTSATFTAPTDSSARMSAAQASAAALTYARRQSLVQVLGLTTCDPDTDGVPIGGALPGVSEEQAHEIEMLAEEVGADKARFLAYMGVEAFSEIRAADYDKAVAVLKKKGGKR